MSIMTIKKETLTLFVMKSSGINLVTVVQCLKAKSKSLTEEKKEKKEMNSFKDFQKSFYPFKVVFKRHLKNLELNVESELPFVSRASAHDWIHNVKKKNIGYYDFKVVPNV